MLVVQWKICMKSTFIDIEENCPKPLRSNSEPILTAKHDIKERDPIEISSAPLKSNEVLCRHLDSGLGLGGEAEPPQDVADVADVVDVVDVALAPEDDGESDSGRYSKGTRGHPEVCKRPCVHFFARGCALGASCNYCHAEHPKRPISLDKAQRRLLGKVEEQHLLEIVLGQLRDRAERKGFYKEAGHILQMLEERWTLLHNPDLPASWSPGEQQTMRRVLGKMTFAGLVGLALARSSEPSDKYSQDVNSALEQLRQALPTIVED